MAKRDENNQNKKDKFWRMYTRNWIICIISFILLVILFAYNEKHKDGGNSSAPSEAFSVICLSELA